MEERESEVRQRKGRRGEVEGEGVELDGDPLDPSPGQLALDDGLPEWCEEVFNIIIHVIPLSLLYVVFDIMIHAQYGLHPRWIEEVERLRSNVPVLLALVAMTLYTLKRYPGAMQLILLPLSVVFGTTLIWTVNTAPYLAIMRRCPGLGVLWIFSIICLDLGRALAALVVVGAWTYLTGYKIFF